MINSAIETATFPEFLEFCLYLDENEVYIPSLLKPANLVITRGPSLPTSLMTNIAYSVSHGEILMYSADDIVFRTQDWDQIVRETFEKIADGIGLIYGDDLGQDSRKIATHGFVSRRWVSELGYLLPGYFESEFCDTWVTNLARKTGRLIFLPNLIIEHMHPAWGKAELDETYEYRQRRYSHFKLLFRYLRLYFEMKAESKMLKHLIC
jgi:hypothetical protein